MRPPSSFLNIRRAMALVHCLVLAFASIASAMSFRWPSRQPAPDFEPLRAQQPQGLSLTLSLPKDRFFQGETIPATLVYAQPEPKSYHIYDGAFRPGGRPEDITFQGRDQAGHRLPDPPSWYFGRAILMSNGGGSPRGSSVDFRQWSLTVPVNEWLRFDHPGTYTIVAKSTRAHSAATPDQEISLISNSITVTIDPITPAQEQAVFAAARVPLTQYREQDGRGHFMPPSARDDVITAIDQLGYLQTPAALDELYPFLAENDDVGRAVTRALDSVPNPQEVAGRLLAAICRGQPVPGPYVAEIYAALATSSFNEGIVNMRVTGGPPPPLEKAVNEAKQKMFESVRAATARQGPTYAAALYTQLSGPAPDSALRAEFAAHQLELPSHLRRELIQIWKSEITHPSGARVVPLGGPDLLPLLRLAATSPAWDPYGLEVLALASPVDARPLIIADLQRPHSLYLTKDRVHFAAAVGLNALPPTPIPELTETFRAQLAKPTWEIGHLLPLVDRYGTADLLPDVRRFYQPKAGNWECFVEVACLRFILRYSPAAGVADLQTSLNTRQRTACYKMLLAEVFQDFWEPTALPVVEAALNDSDPEVVISAGKILRDHASPATIDTLLTALERGLTPPPAESAIPFWTASLAKSLLSTTRWTYSQEQRQRLEKLVHAPKQ